MILVINTSGPMAQLALCTDDEVFEETWLADKALGRTLVQHLDALLQRAECAKEQLQRVAVHRGPGHFSALRTGIVFAQMVAEAIPCQLVEVSGTMAEQLCDEACRQPPVDTITPHYGGSSPVTPPKKSF